MKRLEDWQLKQRQSLPLEAKIQLTKTRIISFYEYFGGEVYISFSGGKDSTVLLDIARKIYPGITAVFCDTWLEYPEVREHVKKYDNVVILKPEISMREIIKKYGWNFPSKDVAECVYYARRGSRWAINKLQGRDKDGSESAFKQRYKKWGYLLEAPFTISAKCCKVMKEDPILKYEKKTGQKPIMALMAEESDRRKQAYLRTGCNAFDIDRPNSKPMGFWTEQDVLQYCKDNNISLPSVYGEIIEKQEPGQIKGQMCLMQLDKQLTTTGEQRTGCMFCPVGCHLEKINKYERLKETHPQIYDYVMKSYENGGLGLGDALDWLKIKH